MDEAENTATPDEPATETETADDAAPLNRAARRQAKGGAPKTGSKGPGHQGGQPSPKFSAAPARNTGTGHRRKV